MSVSSLARSVAGFGDSVSESLYSYLATVFAFVPVSASFPPGDVVLLAVVAAAVQPDQCYSWILLQAQQL